MFGFIRRWRRKKVAAQPFPDAWRAIIDAELPFARQFDPDLRARFERDIQVFIDEKHFFGAGGFEITDTVKVVVAGCAVRLTLFLDIGLYDRLTEIVVYPGAYKHPDREGGVILGEAHHFGTVVLAWDAVVHGLRNPCDGHDTAIHEFAHVLDRQDGAFDGTPTLRATGDYAPWARVMSRHFLNLRDRREAEEKRVLRDYGAINEAEFFAVATESFFEKPSQMLAIVPELYQVLADFYGFDPAASNSCADAPAERS